MLGKVLLVFAGVFLALILLNAYYLLFCIVFVTALGVENEVFLSAGYWISLVAGAVTSVALLRRAWPK